MNEQQRWSWWSWWWSWWCWVDGLGGWVTACHRFVCTPQTITGALMLVLLLLLSLLLLLLKTSGEYRHQQPIRTHRRTSTPHGLLVHKCISAATIPFSNKYLLDPVRSRGTEVFPADLDRGGGSSGGGRRVHLHHRLISGHREQLQAQLRQLIMKWQSVRAPLA